MDPEDTRYRVETPEQIGLEYDIAGLGTRLMAAIVDVIFLGLIAGFALCLGVFGMTAVFATFSDSNTASAIAIAIVGLIFFFVVWGYYVLFETIWHGQSPGKRWTGLRVIQEGGYPIGFSQAAIRNIVRLADFLPFLYIIGAIVMLVDSRSRRLGDLVAGTIVVKEQQEVSLATLGHDQPPPAPWPASAMGQSFPGLQTQAVHASQFPNLARISSADYSLLREFLQRRATLDPAARGALALQLAQGFARRLDYTPAGDVPEQFLQRLAADLANRQVVPQSQGPAF
ncbi:MAG TPA: RDD family protein [Thermomicrobiales bacterium]|nr:RDD family protein [Thermomicrobiales bacterium]